MIFSLLLSLAFAQTDFFVSEADLKEFPLKASARARSRSIDENILKQRAIDSLLKKLEACSKGTDQLNCSKKAIRGSDLDIPTAEVGKWETKVIPANGNPQTPPARK